MLRPRPPGTTLRRAREAVSRPAPADERFDPDFPTALQCADCGKFCFGPNRHLAEAMREHRESDCPNRLTNIDKPHLARILYPRT